MKFIRGLIIVCALALTGVVACGQAPVQAWVQRYQNPDGNGVASAVATDNEGNVFVAGASGKANASYVWDYAVIKYASSGLPLWTNRFGALAGAEDAAIGMAVNGAGSVFIACNATNASGVYDIATVGYSSDGLALWTNRMMGLSTLRDYTILPILGIAADRSNHIFVTATSTNLLSGWDFVTVAYSISGVALWTNYYDGPINARDRATAVAVNSHGEVIVAGFSQIPNNFTSESVLMAYSNSGETLWSKRFRRAAGDFVMAMAIDKNDNVFLTGLGQSSLGQIENVTFGFSRMGLGLWTNSFPSAALDGGMSCAIDTSDDGSVFVTGRSAVTNQTRGWATVAYSSTGGALWTNRFRGSGSGDDWPQGLVVDGRGNTVMTGWSSGSNSYEAVTIGYSPDGAGLWTNRYNVPSVGGSQARALVAGRNGGFLVAGRAGGDFLTIKYAWPGPLQMHASKQSMILNWTNGDFELQSAAAPDETFTYVSGATSPYTNVMSEGRKFFRVISN